MQIFADADYFIGLYFTSDPHHKKCLKIVELVEDSEIITSYDVIDEVVTKLSYFRRKDKAQQFIKDIIKIKMQVVYPDRPLFESAVNVFSSIITSHVSLTDCMNMAIMKERGIKKVLSFDKTYEQNGFELVK